VATSITSLERRFTPKGRDTGEATLPSLMLPRTGNEATDAAFARIKEHLEVREGRRGNQWERVVTQRDIAEVNTAIDALKEPKAAGPGEVVVSLGGGLTATMAVSAFEASIRGTRLYQDLRKSLDDPSRFDDLRAEVRDVLLRSLAEEAMRRGADISTTRQIIQNATSSIAMQINEVMASVGRAAAGVREVAFATAETNRAQAGKITQLEASLGNFYQDGAPGRVKLEEQMTATADAVEGLRGQWSIKIQAGNSIAGIGLSASDAGGEPESAFIIAAGKFAIVDPATYTGGLVTNPDEGHIPFGVDAHGIYMTRNVYLLGSMFVDTGGKTLIDGLRGSVNISAGTGAWSDTAARNAVWSALGNAGSPTNNNHLVIGDTVTMGSGTSTTARMWNGSAWVEQGVFINGNLIATGTISAPQINTNGLTIRDANGNIIFNAGAGLTLQGRLPGLGTMATANGAKIGSTVQFPDGTVMGTTDFVNALSKINSNNISTFMESAAIGNAYIGNAAVGTLNIAGGAVTSMRTSTGVGVNAIAPGESAVVGYIPWEYTANSTGCALIAMFDFRGLADGGAAALKLTLRMTTGAGTWNPVVQSVGESVISADGTWTRFVGVTGFANPTQNATFDMLLENMASSKIGVQVDRYQIMATGALR